MVFVSTDGENKSLLQTLLRVLHLQKKKPKAEVCRVAPTQVIYIARATRQNMPLVSTRSRLQYSLHRWSMVIHLNIPQCPSFLPANSEIIRRRLQSRARANSHLRAASSSQVSRKKNHKNPQFYAPVGLERSRVDVRFVWIGIEYKPYC